MSSRLDIHAIECRYGSNTVVRDFSFTLEPGHIASLLGPSGCGKTTVLRAIAGFEKIHNGHIRLDDLVLSSPDTQLPPERRHVGMVFQDYSLFPHMTVSDNIAFGLHKLPARERKARVDSLLSLVKLESYAQVYPHQLSGGQQQRVALARALAPQPRLLLMDEPFSNLDTELRRSLSLEVRDILKQSQTTAILVTHDRSEAFNVADDIGVMIDGRLQQWGSAQTLYHEPATAGVARFICDGKFIPGIIEDAHHLRTIFGLFENPRDMKHPPGTPVSILVRPWELVLSPSSTSGCCEATLEQQQFHGALSISTLRLNDGSLVESSDARFAGHHIGDRLFVQLEQPSLRLFAA